MRTCLLDPDQGYYASANSSLSTADHTSRDVLGARGDFITSPEISQVFGELLAIFFVARWQSVSPIGQLRLVELGPGKGTLLADMIRTFARFKTFFKELKTIHLVETSPGLMNLQHEALESALSAVGKRIVAGDQESLGPDDVQIEWFPLAGSVPVKPDTWSMVVAHEFFDALPTHIFERTNDGFREVLVDVKRSQSGQSGITILKPGDQTMNRKAKDEDGKPSFRYVLSPGPTPWSVLLATRNPRFQVLQPGQRVEISPESWATARRVGELVSGRKAKESAAENEKDTERAEREKRERERQTIKSKGGAGLIIDYGDEKAYGASFRAFKQHAIVDPLEEPGTADLTCNVDFGYLKTALATTDAKSLGPMFQAHFLHALGLQQRVDSLKANASDEERRKEIESSAMRLIDPSGMGAQYKAMGISADGNEDGDVAADAISSHQVKLYPFEL